MNNIYCISEEEAGLRLNKIYNEMIKHKVDAVLVSSNANLYYLTGRVFSGYILITADGVSFFVKRPVGLCGANLFYIRKPEEITDGLSMYLNKHAIEMSQESYSTCIRLMNAFPSVEKFFDADILIDAARAIKTPGEIEQIAASGIRQTEVYLQIPSLYKPGMTDVEFQIAIETASRLNGCLGQFRISGNSMELFMANILAGDNADNPTPYDFAMGGAGTDTSLPVGANGTVIAPGMSVMVDCNGNYTGYMTDMTRVFAVGEISELAHKAHECSIRICREIEKEGKPGVEARHLYKLATDIVKEEKLEDYFMGHRQKAGFIGHGVGIEINESPVIAPRSQHKLEEGNVIALEPKFVIPGTGAVGIENTYLVTGSGLKCLTNAPEEIIRL